MVVTLREKCPNIGKYGPEKLRIWTLFMSVTAIKTTYCNLEPKIVNYRKCKNKLCKDRFRGAIHIKWAGPARWAGLPRWDTFYPTFIWNFLSYLKKFVVSLEKRDCFDHVVSKQEFFYFQWGSKKLAAVPFYCTK